MKVGDKVVCVDDSAAPCCKNLGCKERHIHINEIYTILVILTDYWEGPLLRLVNTRGEWLMKRFRPVDYSTGEVIADYIEQTAFKEYEFEETVRELQKWAGSGNG